MATPRFDKFTTGTEVAQVFKDQIHGRHVLVTGASPNSLGEAAALAISRSEPALLILASRTSSNLQAVASRIAHVSPSVTVKSVVVNLASQASVRAAAKEVTRLTDRLDILVNNAGINVKDRQVSPDGIELTFATNHVGPFLLTNLLLPLFQAAAKEGNPGETRIVNVSSDGHRLSPMRFSDFNFEGKTIPAEELPRKGLPSWVTTLVDGYSGVLAYMVSSCARVLFTAALKERLCDQGIESFAVHPGTIRTGLMRNISPEFRAQLDGTAHEFWKTPDQGCATLLVAAFDPSLSGSGCIYLTDCQPKRASPHATDKTKAARLWSLTETLVGANGTASRL